MACCRIAFTSRSCLGIPLVVTYSIRCDARLHRCFAVNPCNLALVGTEFQPADGCTGLSGPDDRLDVLEGRKRSAH